MWEVRGSQKAAKLLARFDNSIHQRYVLVFEHLAKVPKAGKLLQGYENLRSYPVTTAGGEHLIVYQLKSAEKVVYVVLVGSRESICELLKKRGL